MYAASGRRKETRFAKLRILNVWIWNGSETITTWHLPNTKPIHMDRETKDVIANKEGFYSWNEFYNVYHSLNLHNWNDTQRKHYFIEFELVEVM